MCLQAGEFKVRGACVVLRAQAGIPQINALVAPVKIPDHDLARGGKVTGGIPAFPSQLKGPASEFLAARHRGKFGQVNAGVVGSLQFGLAEIINAPRRLDVGASRRPLQRAHLEMVLSELELCLQLGRKGADLAELGFHFPDAHNAFKAAMQERIAQSCAEVFRRKLQGEPLLLPQQLAAKYLEASNCQRKKLIDRRLGFDLAWGSVV